MDGAGVRDPDGELVQVRAGMQPRRRRRPPAPTPARLPAPRPARRRRAGRAARSSPGRSTPRGRAAPGSCRCCWPPFAPDVLLARPQRHDEGAPPVEVGGHADQPAGDLADERVGARRGCRGTARRTAADAQRLALARRDVRAVGSGRREDGERHRLDHRHEQRAGGVRQVGRSRPSARAGRGSSAGARARPRRALRRRAAARAPRGRSCPRPALGDERDLLDVEPTPPT